MNNRAQYFQQTPQKQITRKQQLFIDSRFKTSGTQGNFIVQFNIEPDTANGDKYTSFGSFKNVASVELKGISINYIDTDTGTDATRSTYIILDIEELNNRVNSNVPMVNSTFCTIYCEEGKRFIKGSDFDNKTVYFNPPLSELSRLTIKVKRIDDSDLTEHILGKDITLLFEIVTVHNVLH
tara:strand:- start:894 stop:1436 length:543 start_codon:yes stop_codon:yes gene_type:complete